MKPNKVIKPIHVIHVDKKNVYADGVKIGYHFPDEEKPGYYVNISGVICKGFPSKSVAMLWIAGFVERLVPKAINYLKTLTPINHGFKPA